MSDGALAARLAGLRAARRTALIPYITAGFPDPAETAAFLRGARAAGADAVELGVPWSDPVADGPTIQASTHAALRGGMTLARSLELLAGSAADAPVVVFTYLNPVLARGAARFAAEAGAAGASGLLVTDLPVGADDAVERDLRSAALPMTTPSASAPTSAACAGEEIPKPTAMGRSVTARRDATCSPSTSESAPDSPVTPSRAIR